MSSGRGYQDQCDCYCFRLFLPFFDGFGLFLCLLCGEGASHAYGVLESRGYAGGTGDDTLCSIYC